MEQPKFVGRNAHRAALRWAQISLSRRLLAGLNNVAKRLIADETYDPVDVVDAAVTNPTHLSKNEVILNNYSKLDYLFDSLLEMRGMTESLALVLAGRYRTVESLLQVPPKELSQVIYYDRQQRKQVVGLERAKKILRHMKQFL